VPNGLRVLVVTNMYPTPADPAFGAFVASQVEALRRAGVQVELAFVNGRRSAAAYLAAPFRIGPLARRQRCHLVHAHYGLTGFVAGFHALPLVVTFHGDDLLGTRTRTGRVTVKSRLARRLSHAAARRADALICPSEVLRDALPRAADRARTRVIPMGVNVARFSPGDRAAARARLGLDRTERLVLFVDPLGQAVKRLDLAEAAVARLPVAAPARLWVVRTVPHDGMPDCYRAADCLLVTSDAESGPMVVKEALSCDLPVVSVDVGDVRRWLDRTPGCRLVERDPAAIGRSLHEVLCGPGCVDGSAVRAEVGDDRIVAEVLEVYRLALAGCLP
jgi:teichuronic acid biosynthesis glycosyltransferase TuaC